jgi:hypothetical protein
VIILCVGISPVNALNEVTLSLEPKSLELPLLQASQGSIFTLELKISDVEALKELHVSFKYDSNYVEYLSGKIDPVFNTKTGGWTGDELNGVLTGSFNGYGTLFRYWFKAVKIGSTQITLLNARLIDESGASIPVVTSSCNVKIISPAEYIGGEFSVLAKNYQNLSKSLNETIIVNEQLTSLYNSSKKGYDTLNESYTTLKTNYDTLNANYATLQTNYNKDQTTLNSLQVSNDKLALDYANQVNILYVFIATTAVFLVSTVFFAMKKPAKTQ